MKTDREIQFHNCSSRSMHIPIGRAICHPVEAFGQQTTAKSCGSKLWILSMHEVLQHFSNSKLRPSFVAFPWRGACLCILLMVGMSISISMHRTMRRRRARPQLYRYDNPAFTECRRFHLMVPRCGHLISSRRNSRYAV